MPIERVRIQPDSIIVKNSAGLVKFSTDNKYIKTDNSGQFRAGGFTRCPVVVGSNIIADNLALGGVPIGLISGANEGELGMFSSTVVSFLCPSFDSIIATVNGFGTYAPPFPQSSIGTSTPLLYNGVEVGRVTYTHLLQMIQGYPEAPGIRRVSVSLTNTTLTKTPGILSFKHPANTSLSWKNASGGTAGLNSQSGMSSMIFSVTDTQVGLSLASTV